LLIRMLERKSWCISANSFKYMELINLRNTSRRKSWCISANSFKYMELINLRKVDVSQRILSSTWNLLTWDTSNFPFEHSNKQ
jgi:hypothetical protein